MLQAIIIISILGTILHFMYDLSGKNKIVGLFSSVNESTWEHIKICLSATFIYSLIDGIKYGENPNYFLAKFVSLIIIIILMPLLYYGLKNILKKDIPILNIAIFYITVIVSEIFFYIILNQEPITFKTSYLSLIGILIIFASYLLLTLLPLKNFIFKDPITGKYGFRMK